MRMLIFDPRISGAAGDLLIAALLDMNSSKFRLEFCTLLKELLIKIDPQFDILHSVITKKGIAGTQIKTKSSTYFQSQELTDHITSLGNSLNLSKPALNLALNAINFIIEAELKVHNKDSINNTHLHELASTDTLFDILGFSYLFDKLGLNSYKLILLPIAIGGGIIAISHGKVSVPAPATLEIIKKANLMVIGGPIEKELLTPTGAALLAALNAQPCTNIPLITVQNYGRSLGTRNYESEIIPFLQILEGTEVQEFLQEDIIILETNVDDVDGEILGYLFDLLYQEQLVLDLSMINTITKKNRPGMLIRAIVKPINAHQVTNILIRHLGTLGVRILPSTRHIIPRRIETHHITLNGMKESIQVKKGFIKDELISEKIEFEDIKRLAKKKKKTLREIRQQIHSDMKRET